VATVGTSNRHHEPHYLKKSKKNSVQKMVWFGKSSLREKVDAPTALIQFRNRYVTRSLLNFDIHA
jgi:hypothetical protein